jgi:choline transport protein
LFDPLPQIMNIRNSVTAGQQTGSEGKNSDVIKVQNEDEMRLAQMGEYRQRECVDLCLNGTGHKQELARHFSVWSLIGLAANCTISWTGLGLGLITAINAGGPGACKAGPYLCQSSL